MVTGSRPDISSRRPLKVLEIMKTLISEMNIKLIIQIICLKLIIVEYQIIAKIER